MSKKIKAKYKRYLTEIGKEFTEGDEVLDMIATIKSRIDDLEIEEKSSPKIDGFPVPDELAANPRSFAVFSDGACRGNPGPGAWGALGQNPDGDIVFESSGVDLQTTNNRMEMLGAIEALKNIKGHIDREFVSTNSGTFEVYLYSDSKIVTDGMNSWLAGWKSRGWKKADKKEPENLDLWKELDHMTTLFWKVNFKWVKGHAGHPQNERCDQLANQALDEAGY